MKTSKLDYKEQRDKELLAAFCSHFSKGVSLNDAVRRAIEMPCSRYWISPENARKRISALINGKHYSQKKTRLGRMRLICSIMENCDGDFSMHNIERVVYSKAPRFFLTFETAKRYIYYALRNRQQCKNI